MALACILHDTSNHHSEIIIYILLQKFENAATRNKSFFFSYDHKTSFMPTHSSLLTDDAHNFLPKLSGSIIYCTTAFQGLSSTVCKVKNSRLSGVYLLFFSCTSHSPGHASQLVAFRQRCNLQPSQSTTTRRDWTRLARQFAWTKVDSPYQPPSTAALLPLPQTPLLGVKEGNRRETGELGPPLETFFQTTEWEEKTAHYQGKGGGGLLAYHLRCQKDPGQPWMHQSHQMQRHNRCIK